MAALCVLRRHAGSDVNLGRRAERHVAEDRARDDVRRRRLRACVQLDYAGRYRHSVGYKRKGRQTRAALLYVAIDLDRQRSYLHAFCTG